jgi:DNA repair exonuclease SbcCD ATPase subunit
MIYFKAIRWKNFLSTGNAFTEVQLNKSDTTLIVGENGAGKSTLLDALSFVLYNKPFRKVNKPQLINTINKKDMTVEIDFDIGSNRYHIKRGMKPNLFEVHQNGKLLNQEATDRDYQTVLEKQILKLNHKSFCQVVVLGSASFVPFMELPAGQRREVIEDLLDIQIFSVMNSLLRERIGANSTWLLDVEYEHNLTSEKIKMQTDYIAAIQRKNEDHVAALKAELNKSANRIEEERDAVKELSDKILSYKKDIEDQESVITRQKKLQRLEVQLADKVAKLTSDIEFFSSHDSCPTCKQDIEHEFKCETVADKQSQAQETRDAIEKLQEEISRVLDRMQSIAEVGANINSLNIEIAMKNSSINGLMDQCKNLAKQIKEIQDSSVELEVNDDKMKELEQLIGKLSDEKAELLRDKDALNIASLILKDTGIKAKIIKQYVPVINRLINKYLSAMDFFVNFEMDENFEEKIKSRFRDDFSYSSFSEGEKMRINLSILFTWRAIARLRNSASTNLLIMDEVLDGSLDTNGTDEFLKIVSNLTLDTNTFIISHKVDQLVDKFANVIKFEKHKNFSRVLA